jgi:hypothetical protein
MVRMQRRNWLRLALGSSVVAVAGGAAGALWLRSEPARVATFADPNSVSAWLDALARAPAPHSLTDWPVPQVLEHVAQSIEYSLSGYPQLRSALFRASVGPIAFLTFAQRGRMSHPTTEPIPGAPALSERELGNGIARLRRAWHDFEAASEDQAFAPHFAYGTLDKADYRRAHLMHLAEHAREIALA